jgi:Zn-dependent M28 family amino/carboxypeptidase
LIIRNLIVILFDDEQTNTKRITDPSNGMAATTMDPVDIANILAQELLYQQVIVDITANVDANVSAQDRADRNRLQFHGCPFEQERTELDNRA